MNWERRGHYLYATSGPNVYMIDRRGLTQPWVLRTRHVDDTRWDVVAEYGTEAEAMQAAPR